MKVYIYGNSDESNKLYDAVGKVLEELGLTDFIQIDRTQDVTLAKEMGISKDSALIIEEESIDFKDMIFEGIVPEPEELKSMFYSIIWGGSGWGCGSKQADGSCGTGCSC